VAARTHKARADDVVLTREQSECRYDLRLYVTGMTSRSTRAIENVQATCKEFLNGHYDLEVIDLYEHPDLASTENVIAAPTLVRRQPLPIRRVVGDMTDEQRLLKGLELLRQT